MGVVFIEIDQTTEGVPDIRQQSGSEGQANHHRPCLLDLIACGRCPHRAHSGVIVANLALTVDDQCTVEFYDVGVVVTEFVSRSVAADDDVLRHGTSRREQAHHHTFAYTRNKVFHGGVAILLLTERLQCGAEEIGNMSKSRRQFLALTSLGVLGAAATYSSRAQNPADLPPGAPPAFGTAPAVGPEVSSSTFAEAEKLVQVEMSANERAVAAGSWRKMMAPLYERRTGPHKVALESGLAPATRWDPMLPGLSARMGPQRAHW